MHNLRRSVVFVALAPPAGRIAIMLSRVRVISVLLLGLGVALIVSGLIVPRAVDTTNPLPDDLGESTWTLRDAEAETRLEPEGRILETPVTKQVHLSAGQPADGDNISVRVGESLLRDSRQSDQDRLITASVWDYRMNRVSGHIDDAKVKSQLVLPERDVAVGGVWWKFPSFSKEGEQLDVLDSSLRATQPATYHDTIQIQGRDVLHYRQEIAPTNVRQSYADFGTEIELPIEDSPDTEKAYLFHSVNRDLFVDARTGLVVKVGEQIDDFYGTAAGEPREKVLTFNGEMDDELVSTLMAQAKEMDRGSWVTPFAWVALIVGALLAIAGLVGALRPGRKQA